MPPVHQKPDPGALKSLMTSWLAGLGALPASLILSAAGQGLGAFPAGAGWIGICTPWDGQAWGLVNQPVLNFASLSSAGGYWLGSWAAPFLFAVVILPLSLRLKTVATQLVAVQTAWIFLVIAASWQTALDPHLGHLARWLGFRDLPAELRWLTAAAAAVATVPIVIRVLAMARITHYHLGRGRRLALVLAHLFPVPVGVVATFIFVKEVVPIEACVAVGVPLLVALMVAWFGYPAPLTHPITAVTPRAVVVIAALGLLAWAGIYATGRRLPGDRVAAIQWARDGSFNNIRDWMEPWRAPWLDERPDDEP